MESYTWEIGTPRPTKSREKGFSSIAISTFIKASSQKAKKMVEEFSFTSTEASMRVSFVKVRGVELENTLMLSTRAYTKGSGTRARWKDGDTMNIKILFTKGSFFRILSMDSGFSISIREISTSVSMLPISSMVKESMSGQMVLPTLATFAILKDTISVFGFPQNQI